MKDVDESRDALVVLAVVGVDLCPDATWLLPIQVSRDELLQLSPFLKYHSRMVAKWSAAMETFSLPYACNWSC